MEENSGMRISSFINYLSFEKRYSSNTIEAYSRDLNFFFQYLDAQYEFNDPLSVEKIHVRSWIAHMIEKKLTARSVNRKLSVIRSYYKFFQRSGEIKINPTTGIAAMKTPKRLPSFVKEEEAAHLLRLDVFSEDFEGQRDALILSILYNCGLRRDELINLKEGDIDESAGQIRVTGKGNKRRIIPVSRKLIDQVNRYKFVKSEEMKYSISEYLFISKKGTKLYPKFVYNLVHKYLSMVTTIEKRSPHILRHTFATHLSNNGADLNAIKELLGHSSLAATQIYTHNSIERLKEVYNLSHPKSGK